MGPLTIAVLLLAAGGAVDGGQSKTVVGPSNPQLERGADALRDGDAEEGIRLTELGLANAHGSRERHAALSNLCAGYAMLEQYETAVGFCDQALAENPRSWRALSNRALSYIELGRFSDAEADLDLGQSIAPASTKLKEVRGRLRDRTDPVAPTITIDDRRDPQPAKPPADEDVEAAGERPDTGPARDNEND